MDHGLIKKIFLSSMFCLGVNNALASQQENIICPTIEEIKHFQLDDASATYFNRNKNRITYSAFLAQKKSESGLWVFDIKDLSTDKDSDLKDSLNSSIEKLEPVSVTSFQYNYAYEYVNKELIKIPTCFYYDPNDDSVRAIASFYFGKSSLSILKNRSGIK